MKLKTFQPALKHRFIGFENETILVSLAIGSISKINLKNYINVILTLHK
jgi:hypothetical protein